MINAIPVPAFLVESNDALADANEAFRQLFPNLQIGRSYLTVLRQPALVALIENLKAGIETGDADLVVAGQTRGFYRATGGVLGDQVLICLQDLNETAVAVQMRKNFMADLSHELKTPLTTISGILETSANDTAALVHFLPALSLEVDRMKRLVADLLTLSRVEANEKRTPTQTIVLQAVAEEACASLAALAESTGIRIETDLPENPVCFQADPDEITRAIKNLVENGLRYGNRGGTVIVAGSICEPSSKESAPSVMIEVSNDGPTVESHHIPRLTERFYRIDGHRSRASGGSGLGLAIVKHIVSHHRGRITIESQNQKFRVTLVLPLKQDHS